MRGLVEYINEVSDTFKQFKIDDLMAVLDDNKVSKTRRKEIIKFFEDILGPAPYYCVSAQSPDKKSIKIVQDLQKYGYIEINDDDTEEYKTFANTENASRKQINDWVDSIPDELKEKFDNLIQKSCKKLPKGSFKFGYYGKITDLKSAIAYIDDDFVPCIVQTWDTNIATDFHKDLRTFYFASKDIK